MRYRHGDVILLDPIPMPKSATAKSNNVVAEGEATGHAHRVQNGRVMEYEGRLYLQASDRCALTHEEHNRIEIEPLGVSECYPVIIQREYDDEHEWRKVTD